MPSLLASVLSTSAVPRIERTVELARQFLDMDVALLVEHGDESDCLAKITGSGFDPVATLGLTHLFTERVRRGRRWRVVGDTCHRASTAALAQHSIGAFISAKVICNERVTATLTCLSREPLTFLESSDGKVLGMLADTIAARLCDRAATDSRPARKPARVYPAFPPGRHAEPRRAHPLAETSEGPVALCPACQRPLVRVNTHVGGASVTMRACGNCDLRWWETDGLQCTLTDLLDIVREGADHQRGKTCP